MTDRAVSDVLGFVLVFAIIVSTVGLTMGLGMGGLRDTRNVERLNNAQRAFDVLADNFDRLSRGDAPSRATEVKLSDADLSLADPVSIDVALNGTALYNATTQPLVYDAAGSESLVYVDGALLRAGPEGAVMVRDPGFVFGRERTLVPLLTLSQQPGSSSSVGGSTTVLVRGERLGRTVLINSTPTPDYNLSVRVATAGEPRARAWKRYFEGEGLTCTSPAGGDVTCWLVTDRTYVQVVNVAASFE
ncbi:MAG: hypothetical protein ABEJ28_09390 [Salinigranum sp.]